MNETLIQAGHAIAEQPAESLDAWHARRKAGIGASDAGKVIGVSPWGNAYEVWEEKTGKRASFRGNFYTDFGKYAEPFVFDRIELELLPGIQKAAGSYVHPTIPFMRANPDGLIEGAQLFVAVEGVEIKTSGKPWPSIPPHYIAQCQHSMAVTGLPLWHLVCAVQRLDRETLVKVAHEFMCDGADHIEFWAWITLQAELETFEIHRDEEYIDRLIARESEFWACVVANEPPQTPKPETAYQIEDGDLVGLFNDAARMQRTVAGLITTVYGEGYKDREKDLERLKKQIGATLKTLPTDAKRVECGPHKAVLVATAKPYWKISIADLPDEDQGGQ